MRNQKTIAQPAHTRRNAGLLGSASRFALGVGLTVLAASPALANPASGTVASGSATITAPSSKTTQVNQTSQAVVINWKSFDIANGETTQFNQPSSSSIAVNRIGSASPTQIFGNLVGNGRVVLINPNGMVFGKTAKVNVGALIATTSGGNVGADGKFVFDTAGKQNASVNNQGSISAASGIVALVAPNVSNSGIINARVGSVTLGAANKFTVDFTGDGLVSFATQGDVTKAATVSNSGSILGTSVTMTARAAQGFATGVVNTSGIVQATAANGNGGAVTLDGGVVRVSGSLNASGSKGGTIGVTGSAVSLQRASLDASGLTSGGSIFIGGGKAAAVDAKSTLDVSAKNSGNAGTIAAISSATSFKGNALARGGASGGDGGFVETSGHTVDFVGLTVDTSSPFGKAGQWLVDPDDFTIDAGAAATIHNNLATSDVTIATSVSGLGGNGNILVKSNLSWSTAHDLTLSAYRNIQFYSSYKITSSGTGDLNLFADNIGTGHGTVTFGANNHVSVAPGSSLSIFYNPASYTSPTDFSSSFITGSGEIVHAYMLVNTLANIQAMSSNLTGDYALGNDIDATKTKTQNAGGGFAPIGNNSTPFTGALNGLGHTISNLFINYPSISLTGLFGYTNTAEISNLNLTNAQVTGAASTGILAGELFNSVVSNVSVSGVVTGPHNAGGIAGIADGTQVLHSSSSAAVLGNDALGGLLGSALNATLTDDIASGNVTGAGGNVGGFLGTMGGTSAVTSSYASGNVAAGNLLAGGFIGSITGGTITSSDATGTVSGTGELGGFVGELSAGSISDANASGNVTGSGAGIGGFAGIVDSGTTISQSGASGDVAGTSNLGGFAGENGGALSAAVATGDVSGGVDHSGGFVGRNNAGGSIAQSTSSGMVSGQDYVGGFAGVNLGSIDDSYSFATVDSIVSNSTYAGGFVGDNAGTGLITDSAALGDVTVTGSDVSIGGFAGVNEATIENSWSSGAVSLTGTFATAGGFVGDNISLSSDIENAYAIGSVTVDSLTGPGSDPVIGGFAGNNRGTINSAYANGEIANANGTGQVGGFAGQLFGGQVVTAAYWDTGSTGVGSDSSGATGISNTNAFLQSTYAAFDFTPSTGDWVMIDGYTRPFLQSEIPTDGIVTTTHQLQLMSLDGSLNYTLVADLDFGDRPGRGANPSMWSQYGFVPVGSLTGTFDGGSHTITNLYIQRSDPATQPNTGLFGNIGIGGMVENLIFVNGALNGGVETGMLAGSSSGSVVNVHANGLVQGYNLVGGLIGDGDGLSTVTSSSFAGEVLGGQQVGGLVGETFGSITNSHSSSYPPPSGVSGGVIGSGDEVGGLVGNLGHGASITDSYSTAPTETTSGQKIGGLVGYSDGIITNSYATGGISQGSSQIGGFVGYNDVHGDISDSYATGFVGVGGSAGGFVGVNAGSIETSYASVGVQASNHVGGFVEDNLATGTITDAYSLGSVYGTQPGGQADGGFAGANEGAITNAYSTGATFGNTAAHLGGFVGDNTGTVTNGFWDVDTSFQSSAFDSDGGATATGLSSDAGEGDTAYLQSSFTGFDFTSGSGQWFNVDGFTRPFLQMEQSTLITNAHQLQLVSLDPSASYVLGADIDLAQPLSTASEMWSPAGWAPIGEAAQFGSLGFTSAFTGDFNGNGHAITGLTIKQPTQGVHFVGLFGHIGNPVTSVGTVHDLSVQGVVEGYNNGFTDQAGAGILAGELYGTVRNVSTSGEVSGLDNVGGLIGVLANGHIAYSSSSAEVDGNQRGGGLVGWAYHGGGVIDHSFATGNVGGVDSAYPGEAPRSNGDVTGNAVQGGLVGESDALIQYSYATGSVSAEASEAGGLVGGNEGTIQYSWASGNVVSEGIFFSTGNDTAGGIAGYNVGKIQYAYATGNVSAYGNAGGIAGENGTLHEDPPNADKVGSIGNTWASGTVSAGLRAGGVVGRMDTGTVLNNFFDSTTTGMINPFGEVDSGDTQDHGNLTTAQAMQQSSYVGWNFSSAAGPWVMFSGNTRPFLRSEYSTDITNLHQLQLMALDLNADYTLTTDLSAAFDAYGITNNVFTTASGMWGATGFVPVGKNTAAFTGSLDGDGHTIAALTVLRPSQNYVGLFGYLTGEVSDLTLSGSTIMGNKYVGEVAGYNAGTISNVTIEDTPGYDVTGVQYTGAVAGYNALAGTIDSAHSSANVSGVAYTGGLVGENTGLIEDSDTSGITNGTGNFTGGVTGYNDTTGKIVHTQTTTGSVSGPAFVGGIAGRNLGLIDGEGVGSYASVSGTGSYVGGVAGYNDASGTVENMSTFAPVSVTTSGDYAGGVTGYNAGLLQNLLVMDSVTGRSYAAGIAGRNVGTITEMTFEGALTATGDYAGGIVGRNDATGAITIARVLTPFGGSGVTGNNYLGGLVGANYGAVSLSYAQVDVSGLQYVGGLIGYNAGTVDQTYETGQVSGSTKPGGLIGTENGAGTVTNSYWDQGTAGVTRGAGSGSLTGITGLSDGTLKTSLPSGFLPANWRAGSFFTPYPELAYFAPSIGGGGGGSP